MTERLLARLAESPAAAPAHLPAEQARLYVPVQLLRSSSQLENTVRDDLHAGRTVALVGPSGSGKSSLIHWLAATFEQSLAIITVPVSTVLPSEALATVQPVLQSIVGQLRRQAAAPTNSRWQQTGASAAISVGPAWLRGEARAEIARVTEDLGAGAEAEQLTDQLAEAVALLREDGVTLAIAFDDTDKWDAAQSQMLGDRDRFFRGALRWLADRLDGPALAVVHTRYLEDDDEARIEAIRAPFAALHEVPHLELEEFALMLSSRLANDGAELSDVLTSSAVEGLWHAYADDGSVRRALQVLRGALRVAAGLHRTIVDSPHVQSAL